MNALIVICSLGILSLVAEIVNLKKWLTTFVMMGLVIATGLIVMDWGTAQFYFSDMVFFDNFAISFTALILTASFFWFWMSGDYFSNQPHKTDRSALILFAIAGAICMVSFNNMAMLFLGIEILSISLYVLAGSNKESFNSNEAAFKYFIMGSFATGFLLMGIALIYGATGSFNITTIAAYISSHIDSLPGFFYAGVLLMLIGMTFKISAVPFHFWAPDVYGGSPTTITAFMSTVVKVAAFGAFYKMFSFCFYPVHSSWVLVIQIMTVLTLVIPNITAVYQNNVKRILAYSSVGHVGYLLLAVVANTTGASGTILFYLTAYSVASLLAFTVLHVVEGSEGNNALEKFNGLYKRNPWLASSLTIAMLSLAGIPPLAGFFGKYMVFSLALQQGYVALVLLAVGTSLVGVYYYFKVIVAMFFKDSDEATLPVSLSIQLIIGILVLLVFLLGLFPDWMITRLTVS
ncbi:MAG TPA: NADH-quinone oxidoreductase subunit N [Chryseolinea sp.]|nr:NADH-quinone oxidoreductase subunit N [Chryseolinea sp.]HPM32281.1 NADH-quinone oxidoreductase subunit N [Chryseolinea sp.]